MLVHSSTRETPWMKRWCSKPKDYTTFGRNKKETNKIYIDFFFAGEWDNITKRSAECIKKEGCCLGLFVRVHPDLKMLLLCL